MVLVTVTQEVDVPCLVLLPILEVVHANVRVGDVTHFVFALLDFDLKLYL